MPYAWKKRGLRWYELLVLRAVRDALPRDQAALMAAQLRAINRVIRVREDREVTLYRATGGLFKRPDWDGVEPLRWDGIERLLGRCELHCGASGVVGTVFLTNGFVCALAFDEQPVRLIRKATKIANVRVEAESPAPDA